MSALFDKTAPQNVHGLERAASVAGGLILLSKGVRRGGLGGLVQIAMGGMALARGMTGRCETKRILAENNEQPLPHIARYSHMPMDSEVHSPDFEDPEVTLPDTTPMGHETHSPLSGIKS
ncbi:DUF2892 domain-containing protein [Pseudomonas sp. PDM14]|uniref:YgaP-like transmembrane domain n=1 Tax=Pseudomonas sp. PDM14 TaxID=2769288 RepID=UPI00177C2BD9|nr:YgaP-like transmembrane domain [Pseudomonas sp. PDM14]MBD9484783.1 DUF2892 domain-containing protein [Pseudomonas sp. PDM14]